MDEAELSSAWTRGWTRGWTWAGMCKQADGRRRQAPQWDAHVRARIWQLPMCKHMHVDAKAVGHV